MSHDAATLNILVIDDMERLAVLLELGLKSAGHLVATAFSGQEGLDLYRSGSYDLVISDLAMEDGLDGLEVCRTIRSICEKANRPKTPCIILTGWGSELDEDDPRISEAGVDLILTKPVELPDLLTALAALTAT
ncbi:MAG: response regulator [Desulfomonile tiedjei]|nr:response regulator [Desulfomonile tiedjei]